VNENNEPRGPGGTVLRVDARKEFDLDRSPRGHYRLISGWAAEQVVLSDGRRQVTGLFLAGERIIPSPLSQRENASSLLAITPLQLRFEEMPAAEAGLELLRAELHRHLSQWFRAVVRLGSMTAYEKTANLLLEIAERSGPSGGESIDFPLTQELLGDLLGLSQVHVNRTLQQLRRDGLIELQGGRLTILELGALRTAGEFHTLFPASGKMPDPRADKSARG
jgi:CRP-like cAMP-binding protein